MHPILTLLRKDIAQFFRNKAVVTLTFAVPIVLIYIFGFVWGLNRKASGGPSGIRLAVVNASTHPAAQKLVAALQAEKSFRVQATTSQPDGTARPLTEAEAETLIRDNSLRFALVIPPDLITSDRLGIRLRILSNPQNTIEAQMVMGLLQKTIFTNVPQLLGESLQQQAQAAIGGEQLTRFNRAISTTVAATFGGDAAEIQRQMEAGDFGFSRLLSSSGSGGAAGTSGAGNAESMLSSIVKIETKQIVGQNVKNSQATTVIGGQAIMFLLFAVSGGAAAFFDEKNAGLFQRLLSAPVTRGQLLWSRFLFGVLVGVVQLLALFLAGRVLYGVDVFGHFGNLLVVCLASAAACSAFGMFVAAYTPNAQAASGLATLLVLTMSATGGAWFPIGLMPEFMQTVGKFTLVYWSMEGFSRVLWAGDSFFKILPTVGILLAIATGVMALAIWRLNRRRLFD